MNSVNRSDMEQTQLSAQQPMISYSDTPKKSVSKELLRMEPSSAPKERPKFTEEELAQLRKTLKFTPIRQSASQTKILIGPNQNNDSLLVTMIFMLIIYLSARIAIQITELARQYY